MGVTKLYKFRWFRDIHACCSIGFGWCVLVSTAWMGWDVGEAEEEEQKKQYHRTAVDEI
jgi:hypothetical protein